MSSYGGWAGKVLHINLNRETISEYAWTDLDRERYLGGKIMVARILLAHLSVQELAFSEETCVVITTGPLTGTGAPGSARFDIAFLSPQKDLPAFSNCGGDFGIQLKKAGYDGLILTGRCREKRWLEIRRDTVAFHDAKPLWGTGTVRCQQMLSELLGTQQFGRLCIGHAGENLVKFASAIGDGHAAGRAGIGAVLGYQNLKAITVSGDGEIPVFHSQAAAAWNRAWHADLQRKAGDDGRTSCRGCPLRCRKTSPPEKDAILNDLGMDGIAADNAAAWAAEQGISVQGLYEDIALRRGIGDRLAEGVPFRRGKDGKRRGGNDRALAKAFGLAPDAQETKTFCRALTEAVSSAGQCIFTLNALESQEGEAAELPAIKMLELVTGMELNLDQFLQFGMRALELEQQLNLIFGK